MRPCCREGDRADPEYRLRTAASRASAPSRTAELIHKQAAGAEGIDHTWPLIRYPLGRPGRLAPDRAPAGRAKPGERPVGLCRRSGPAIPALLGTGCAERMSRPEVSSSGGWSRGGPVL